MTELIIGGRRTGKTRHLIELSCERQHAILIVATQSAYHHTSKMMYDYLIEMGRPPELAREETLQRIRTPWHPQTQNQIDTHYIYVDDVDMALAYWLSQRPEAMSIQTGEIWTPQGRTAHLARANPPLEPSDAPDAPPRAANPTQPISGPQKPSSAVSGP